MGGSGSRFRRLLRGADIILLFATRIEAEPLLDVLNRPQTVDVATKEWWSGRLVSQGEGCQCPVVVGITGYEKANLAHALTCALEAASPRLVLLAGIAGAFPSAGLGVGDVVLPTVEVYGDVGVLTPGGFVSADAFKVPVAVVAEREYRNSFALDAGLVRVAATVLEQVPWQGTPPRVVQGPAVTLSHVTGRQVDGEVLRARWGALIETMEGAAGAHISLLYQVPFLELRAVSNLVVDRDRQVWDVRGAAARAAEGARFISARLNEVLDRASLGGGDLAVPR